MSGSTIAIIYGAVIVLFFVLLIVLTITLIVSKGKGEEEQEEDVKEYTSPKKKKNYDYSEYEDEYSDLSEFNGKTTKKAAKNDSIFAEADSAFADTSVADSTFTDSAFADSAFGDIVQERKEPASDDEEFDDGSYTGADVTTIDLKLDENYDAIVSAEIPEEDSAFAPEMPIEAHAEDSAFAPEMSTEVPVEDSAFAEDSAFNDSAFGVPQITEEAIDLSVKEAIALSAAMTQPIPPLPVEATSHTSHGTHNKHRKSSVPITDDFYWYNKMDVADKPSYKTVEMYYHHFNVPQDCIEDLLMEMYDCALVRTEEIKYIAYGIEPRAVSMREILTSGNRNYTTQAKLKEPTTQDLVRIYEKWCGYVDKLFEKVEIHADDYTINEIRRLLCEFGRSDVDVLIEGM